MFFQSLALQHVRVFLTFMSHLPLSSPFKWHFQWFLFINIPPNKQQMSHATVRRTPSSPRINVSILLPLRGREHTTATSWEPLALLHAQHCTAAPSQCLFISTFGCYEPGSFVLPALITLHLISCRAESASAAAVVDLSHSAACPV